MAFHWAQSQLQRVQRVAASPLARNILTNYLTVIWLGGLGIALIPVYLRLLGAQQWGVVAICITIQTFAGLLDAGLAQILPRDIARCNGNRAAQAQVYRVFARAYWVLGLLGMVLGQLGLTLISNGTIRWFDAEVLQFEPALRTVLLQFFFQFANNAAMGYWNGSQMQGQANARQCVFGTLKHGLAVALLVGYAPEVNSYVWGFAAVGASEWWLNRRAVLRHIAGEPVAPIHRKDYVQLAAEAGVLAVGVFIGMLVSQIDRLVLSSSVPPAEFGRYVIVANLGLAFLQLQYPLMRALFPRVVAEQAGQHRSQQGRYAWVVVALCVLPCVLMLPLVPWFLGVWLHDAEVVAQGTWPLRLILIAVALNGLYHLIYQKILAQGQNRVVVGINVVVLAVIAPLLVVGADRYGILAGGVSWFIMSALQLALALIWLATQGKTTPDNRIS